MNMDGMQDMFAQQSQPEQFNEQPTSSSIDSFIDQGPEVEQVNIPSQDELNPYCTRYCTTNTPYDT